MNYFYFLVFSIHIAHISTFELKTNRLNVCYVQNILKSTRRVSEVKIVGLPQRCPFEEEARVPE